MTIELCLKRIIVGMLVTVEGEKHNGEVKATDIK